MKIVAFGDNIVDRFVDRRIAYPGGNCVNLAVYAAAAGAEAVYVGVVGNDAAGDLILGALGRHGVDLRRVIRRDGPTGVTDLVTRNGDRVFLDWNGGGVTTAAPYRLDLEDLRAFAGADLVHSSVYSASESELPKLRAIPGLVSFDYSSEPEFRTDDYLAATAPYADLVLFSAGSASTPEIEELADRARRAGAGLVLVTRGADGAILFTGGTVLAQPALPVPAQDVVDTTGCGDAFLTGFVLAMLDSGWKRGVDLDEPDSRAALRAGAESAARQCYVEGAFGMGEPYDDPAVPATAVTPAES
ncbi:PfkB family carbohydrate kinase [Curtobacterium sp. MCPF17_002]|uniref:PfkB family carbohydrate kinase n=1 Tax=Curtobacterium sp. MCPF17_002 TaxID=2175645 RepID=UPI000DA9F3CC|nr:PfkB family carbohydrate kinase [Curtobacterium sp. MCPF17_002]WIB77940.1 PfkB family carbohydrate kinase [Curtobacterium sp. MCPF17_002]